MFKSTPNYSKLWVFDYLYYPWLLSYSHNKHEPRSRPLIFPSYCSAQSAYKCLELSTNKVYIFRDVRLIENEFPYPMLKTKHQSLKPQFIHGLPLLLSCHPPILFYPHPNLLFHLGMPTNSQPTNTSFVFVDPMLSHILPWKVTHQIPPHMLLQLLFPQTSSFTYSNSSNGLSFPK